MEPALFFRLARPVTTAAAGRRLMYGFWIALSLVFIAEMGDRTQLLVLALASKYRARTVFLGAIIATFLLHLLAALIGKAAGSALPLFWLYLLGGASFIGFGLWSLRPPNDTEEEAPERTQFGVLFTVMGAFILAEVGDKSTFLTLTLASDPKNRLAAVWAGSSVGMLFADGLAILLGKLLGKRLPERLIRSIAALIFIALGVIRLVEAFRL
jgi:Ca2+/H+ antiporter, TMEM165/GDT1 family